MGASLAVGILYLQFGIIVAVLLFFDGARRHRCGGAADHLFGAGSSSLNCYSMCDNGSGQSLAEYTLNCYKVNSSGTDSYNELAYIEARHEAFMSVCLCRKSSGDVHL